MFTEVTQETLALIGKMAQNPAGLNKTTMGEATGLNAFDLKGPALSLYPVLTPLRNRTPRETTTAGDVATRWKAVTGINTNFATPGVQAGRRGPEVAFTTQDYLASYAGLGLEASIDWEEVWAGGKEFDNKATLSRGLLNSVMLSEERVILGGNASLALGTCPTPVATGPTAGGAITAQAGNLVFCVALTLEGLTLVTGSQSGLGLGQAGQSGFIGLVVAGTACQGSVTRTNIDGTTTAFNGGNSQVSAASNAITTTGGNQTISATVAAVKGAAGYAWYTGLSAATAALAAVTTINAVTLVANGAGTQKANDAKVAADFSANGTEFDGFTTLAAKTSSAPFKSLDGAAMTADGSNGITEIDALLQQYWDVLRLSPTEMWTHSQEQRNITKKVMNSGANSFQRVTSGQDDPMIAGGKGVEKYFNKFTNSYIDLNIHPNMPAGTILFKASSIPYPLAEVGEVAVVRCRRDYYQIEWPVVSRQYVYGVYLDEVLVHRAPFSLGVLANIANG